MARDFSRKFYNSIQWQNQREYILKRDNYLCRRCGCPAEEVHHIVRLSPNNIDDENVSLNPDNLISLCRECHFDEHRGEHGRGREKREQEEQSEYEFDENGYLVRKNGNG